MNFSHSIWIVAFFWSLTGCAGVGDLSPASLFALNPTTITPMNLESPAAMSFSGNSSGLLMPVSMGTFLPASALSLSERGDGAVSIRSDGKRLPFLSGLDPADVNPAVLPFLYPSCDVPPFLVGDER